MSPQIYFWQHVVRHLGLNRTISSNNHKYFASTLYHVHDMSSMCMTSVISTLTCMTRVIATLTCMSYTELHEQQPVQTRTFRIRLIDNESFENVDIWKANSEKDGMHVTFALCKKKAHEIALYTPSWVLSRKSNCLAQRLMSRGFARPNHTSIRKINSDLVHSLRELQKQFKD